MIVDFNYELVIIPDTLIMIILLLLNQPYPISHLFCEPFHFLPCLLHALIYLFLDLAHVHSIEQFILFVDLNFRGYLFDPLLTFLHHHLLLLHDPLSYCDSTAPVLLPLQFIRQLFLRPPQLLQILHLLIQISSKTINF